MKTFVRLATITGGLLLATGTFAQDKREAAPASQTTSTSPRPSRISDRGALPLNIERMTSELKLTPEQVEKLKAVDAAAQKERSALSKDMAPEERQGKVREIGIQRDKEVAGILTAEQNEQWKASKGVRTKQAATMRAEPAIQAPAKTEEKKVEKQ